MNSKKVLALIMGAIVAASGMSQMAVQVYAHDEESSSSSYSDDYLGDISFLDEEESSGSAEPMENSPAVEELKKLTNFKSERIKNLPRYRYQMVDDPSNLYVSTSNLVFKPTSDTEARLVCLDEESEFNKDIVVPEKVSIKGKPYSVTSIGIAAFYECGNLENVTLPASITRIGDNAFAYCKNLQLETLPGGIETIGKYAFSFCDKLNLRTLPANLHEIGDSAFTCCGELNLIELPANLRKIGKGVFFYCKKLQLEELPKGITTIGDRAFSCCENLQLTALPEGLTTIGVMAFSDCENLQLAALPEGLTTIGRIAFSGCKKLQLAALPDDLRIIDESAFKGCHELNLRELPANLRKIGNSAFAYCKNLQLETLPRNLEIIGEEAFRSTAIRTITIPASVVELGNSAFDTDSIEEINLAYRSRLNDGDIERAYGRQLERIQRMAIFQQGHLRIRQRIITPVELNAEDAERKCPICQERFNEGEDVVGRLICGHYMHLDCFDEQVRNNFERGVPFKCPICRREYNIF